MNLLSRFGGRIWDPWCEFGQLQNEMSRALAGARAYNRDEIQATIKDGVLKLTLPKARQAVAKKVTVTAG